MSDEAAPQIAEAVIASPQEVGHKIFVGNLAFSTKNSDLKDVFSSAGEISDAQIITRGSRSLGYGFVTFAKEQDALNAVSALDKYDIAGRQINVELAKPPSQTAAGRIPRQAAKAAAEKGLGRVDGEQAAEDQEGEGEAEEGQRRRKPRGKAGRARGAKSRKPRTDAETEEAGDQPNPDTVADQLATTSINENGVENGDNEQSGATKRKKRSGRRNAAPKVNEDGTPVERKPRAPRRRGPPTGEPSQTLLFVANLPFSVNDEALEAIFDGYKINSARVVTKKFGPSEGRSKGFGFVDFASHEDQQRALQECQEREVEGRQIQLKVAVQEDRKAEGGEAGAETAAAAGVDKKDLEEAEASIIAS